MYDIFSEIWATARRNKLRTILMGFSVAWGIFILIFLLGAGNGLINASEENAGRVLDNSMMVGGGRTSKPYEGLEQGRPVTLDDKDIEATEHRFDKNVDRAGASISQSDLTITFGDNYTGSNTLTGVYPVYAEVNKIEMLHGRFINETDNRERRKAVVLSESQADELAPLQTSSLVGRYVKAGDFAYRVVGIYKDDNSQMNTDAYAAFNTIRTIYNRGDKADQIFFTFHGLNSMQDNDDFEKAYRATLNRNHRAAPDDEEAVWIWNRFTQNMQMNTGMGIIRTALWVIGLFTLLSGIVGVSNIMLITVKERTREFGIRKAIGATPWSILRLIIVESVIITTLSGFVGMVCGIAANQWMDNVYGHQKADTGLFEAQMFLNPTVGIDVCVEALVVMIVAGTIAGLVPARRVAKTRPIEALNDNT